MALVPDEPQEIRIQLARQEFLTEKAILKLPDEVLGSNNNDDDDGVGVATSDPMSNASKEFDIHTYHKTEGVGKASYNSNFRMSGVEVE